MWGSAERRAYVGRRLVAFAIGPSSPSMSSALTTGALGAFGGQLLASIGVAAAGTAICID